MQTHIVRSMALRSAVLSSVAGAQSATPNQSGMFSIGMTGLTPVPVSPLAEVRSTGVGVPALGR